LRSELWKAIVSPILNLYSAIVPASSADALAARFLADEFGYSAEAR
jgi:hypothetical protein